MDASLRDSRRETQPMDDMYEDRDKAFLEGQSYYPKSGLQSLLKSTLIKKDPGGININATGSPDQTEASSINYAVQKRHQK
jgi:hypothetical protein